MADDAALSKKREREKVLIELRAKRNQGRKALKDEVLAETIGEKLQKSEGHAEYLEQRKAAEAAAVAAVQGDRDDVEKTKRMELTATEMEAIRKRKGKKEANAGFEWVEHNAESKYKGHKKRLETLDQIMDVRSDYERQKASGKEMTRELDDLHYGEAPEVPEARMRALVEELEIKRERKKGFHRRRGEYDEQGVLAINSKNKQYVKKLDRAYGKYTSEIADNLERGTAL